MNNQINQMLAIAYESFQCGNYDKAEVILSQVLKNQSKSFDALHILGIIKGIRNQHRQALELFNKALRIDKSNSFLHFNIAKAFSEIGEDEKALKYHLNATNLNPYHPEGWLNYGKSLSNLNQLTEALDSYSKAIDLNPQYAEAWINQGVTFQQLESYDRALSSFDKALLINPLLIEAWSNRGAALHKLHQYDQALASFEKVLSIKPDFSDAWNNRGIIFNELKQYDQALASFEKTLSIKPDFSDAWNNRGNILQGQRKYEDALLSFDKAISFKPDFSEAWSNRGNIFQELKQYDQALACFDNSIRINPDSSEAWSNRGNTLKELKCLSKALASYERAFLINPDQDYLLGTILHTKMQLCDWMDFEANVDNLLVRTIKGKKSSLCFPILALTDSLSIQRKTSEIWMSNKHPPNYLLGSIPKLLRKERIKIGYYSSDFREHPVSYLAAELFELHDRNCFELIGFYYGPLDSSNTHKRVSLAFDQFIDIRLKSDSEVAALSRHIGIDIAVDLTGLTEYGRVGIFSYRSAPIQVNYLGYSGTIAAEYYDYIIADKVVIPENNKDKYIEKIIFLPNSYLPYPRGQKISSRTFSKHDYKLPERGFVFCCFNAAYKITPKIFASWMRILIATENSVIWLSSQNDSVKFNLSVEAAKCGIDPSRLIFANRTTLIEEHLSRHSLADLFLDTMPYNAHTTTLDALWAGLPVLTCMGESFASRVAASLLNAIELPELITTTQQQYEAAAIDLANNPKKLKTIKDKLDSNRLTTALFDTPRFTKDIEVAFLQIYERYLADLHPDHIYIET